jgi:uncharacterized protein YfaP (DUF2135 family)
MACTLKQCAAALLLLAAAAQAVHLDFAAGLNGWQHSDDEKYAGKFELATPEGLTSQALKVGGTLHLQIAQKRRRVPPPDQRPGGLHCGSAAL